MCPPRKKVATEETLLKENQYSMFLKKKCQTMDKERAERQQTRGAEIAVVEGAFKDPDADDAHQTFSFLQANSADQLLSKAGLQDINSPTSQPLCASIRSQRSQQPSTS